MKSYINCILSKFAIMVLMPKSCGEKRCVTTLITAAKETTTSRAQIFSVSRAVVFFMLSVGKGSLPGPGMRSGGL